MDAAIRSALLRRGGSRQLESNALLIEQVGVSGSVLAERLMMLCGWGLVSANTVRWLAEGARMDGLVHDDINKLASLGCKGAYAGNCRRDLLRLFAGDMEMPKPYDLAIPTLDKRKRVEWRTSSILPVTALIDMIWSSHNSFFVDIFGASPRDFWSQVSPSDPKLRNLGEVTSQSGWQDVYYPYIIHGDGGRFTNKNSNRLMCVQIKGLLGVKFDFNILPLFALPKSVKAKVHDDSGEHETFDRLWRQAVSFLNALFFGIHPDADIDEKNFPGAPHLQALAGTTICRGRARFVCWGIAGDLDFFGNDLHFPHYNSLEPCWFCPVSRSPVSTNKITDMRVNADWKGALFPEVIGCHIPPSTHPILSIVGITRYHAPGDLMHSGHLGQDSFMLGGVLHELVYDGPFTGFKQQRLDKLWDRITFWYDQLDSGTRLTCLKESMFTNVNDFSVLNCKAAEANQLLIVMCEVCKELNDGSDRDQHRLLAVENLAKVYKILKDSPMFLNHQQYDAALEAYENHLLHYNWLLKRSLRNGFRNYPITIKTHMMWHIVHLSKWLNPRCIWCYEFEDWVGTMTTSAKGCVAGSPMGLIGDKVMQNDLLVLQLVLKRKGRH